MGSVRFTLHLWTAATWARLFIWACSFTEHVLMEPLPCQGLGQRSRQKTATLPLCLRGARFSVEADGQ